MFLTSKPSFVKGILLKVSKLRNRYFCNHFLLFTPRARDYKGFASNGRRTSTLTLYYNIEGKGINLIWIGYKV
jgi:hypothetical protein